MSKSVEDLTPKDLEEYPVWRMASTDEPSELLIEPVQQISGDLTSCLVGSRVSLADGSKEWALLGNITIGDLRRTSHFITLAVLIGDRWVQLARYHDPDALRHGAEHVAQRLGKPLAQVFPIAYDLRDLLELEDSALVGAIEVEPRERLSRAQLIAMSLGS